MSQDSLGKKTHLPSVLQLFSYAKNIWPGKRRFSVSRAAKMLGENDKIRKIFIDKHSPFDVRARQAYVKRFFKWIELPSNIRDIYPTVIMAYADSIALRQSLYLDFVFNTSETPNAISGLNNELRIKKKSSFILSPKTHAIFCRWIGVKSSDNTRRAPFARWLEDAGLATPVPERREGERSIIVSLNGLETITPEALIYGLFIEFCRLIDLEKFTPVQLTISQIERSFTVNALLIDRNALEAILGIAESRGYIIKQKNVVNLDPDKFILALGQQIPLPGPGWVREDVTVDDPVSQEIIKELSSFPGDDCYAQSGDPLTTKGEIVSRKEVMRDKAFSKRVAASYRNACAISRLVFRAPYGNIYYGEAAHIIPHAAKDKHGNEVYGKSVVSNGIYLEPFWHWCLDRGWITLLPKIKNGDLQGYRLAVSTIALEEFFKNEWSLLSNFDNRLLGETCLPMNKKLWPSLRSLEWHKENKFADYKV